MSHAAWFAFGGLVFTVVLQTVGFAFWLGGMSARLRHLESRPGPTNDCEVQLAAVNATLVGLETSLNDRIRNLEHTMRNLLMPKTASRTPRRD